MKINLYGIPTGLAMRWILERDFKNGVGDWLDVACGNGVPLYQIGITPKRGLGIDVMDKVPNLPQNFTFQKAEISDWYGKNKNEKYDLVTLFGIVEHLPK